MNRQHDCKAALATASTIRFRKFATNMWTGDNIEMIGPNLRVGGLLIKT